MTKTGRNSTKNRTHGLRTKSRDFTVRPSAQPLNFEVILMAGGRGERLRPLTEDTPKPLLKIGDKPVAEYAIRRLIAHGVEDFTFVVNYLGEKIEEYFGDGESFGARFRYHYEQEPMGTIGGAAQISHLQADHLLVLNADLLTTIHFDRFFAWYLENQADIAVAAVPYQVDLAFGMLDIDNQYQVRDIKEKPTYTHHINTGIYLLRREMLDHIPTDRPFDAVDLISDAMKKDFKVVAFPLLDYWLDIGRMEDFRKAQKDIEFLDLK